MTHMAQQVKLLLSVAGAKWWQMSSAGSMYSGDTVTRVLSDLLENRNYLHLVSYMISTDIFVAFKFRKKLYMDKLWSLLNGEQEDFVTWFQLITFPLLLKCTTNLMFGNQSKVLPHTTRDVMLPHNRFITHLQVPCRARFITGTSIVM